MIGFIKKLFGAAPAAPVAEPVPYKVETTPVPEAAPMPVGIEAIVATPVVEEKPKAPAVAPKKAPAPKKQHIAKQPQAPKVKLPQAPKPAGTNKGPRKPKSKPAA
jgi:hypothetical protein